VEMISVSQLNWSRPTFVDEQISVRIALVASLSESPIPDTHTQNLQVDVCNGDGAVVATMSATAAIAAEPTPGAPQ